MAKSTIMVTSSRSVAIITVPGQACPPSSFAGPNY